MNAPFGRLSGLTFGNSVVAALTYDQDYQLTGIDSANGGTVIQDLTYGYDAAGNITSITDNQTSARSQTLAYDNLNRLSAASGLYGSQSYTYDGVGNRLTRVIGGTTDTYAYSPTANQINTVTTGSNVRTFHYFASGQVSEDIRDPSSDYTFAANVACTRRDQRNRNAESCRGVTLPTIRYPAILAPGSHRPEALCVRISNALM